MAYFNSLLPSLHLTVAGSRCLFWLPGPVSLYQSLVPVLGRQSLNQTSHQPVIQNKESFPLWRNQLLMELVVGRDSTLSFTHMHTRTSPPPPPPAIISSCLYCVLLGARLNSSIGGGEGGGGERRRGRRGGEGEGKGRKRRKKEKKKRRRFPVFWL